MSNGFYIEHVPTRNNNSRTDHRNTSTAQDWKQAKTNATSIPGANLLNRNRNVSDLLADIPRPPDWHADSLCKEVDGEIFFPDNYHPANTLAARRICATCDVKLICLKWALDTCEPHGILGGLTPNERKALRDQEPAA